MQKILKRYGIEQNFTHFSLKILKHSETTAHSADILAYVHIENEFFLLLIHLFVFYHHNTCLGEILPVLSLYFFTVSAKINPRLTTAWIL